MNKDAFVIGNHIASVVIPVRSGESGNLFLRGLARLLLADVMKIAVVMGMTVGDALLFLSHSKRSDLQTLLIQHSCNSARVLTFQQDLMDEAIRMAVTDAMNEYSHIDLFGMSPASLRVHLEQQKEAA